MKAVSSLETSVAIFQSTRRNISQNLNLQRFLKLQNKRKINIITHRKCHSKLYVSASRRYCDNIETEKQIFPLSTYPSLYFTEKSTFKLTFLYIGTNHFILSKCPPCQYPTPYNKISTGLTVFRDNVEQPKF